MNLERHQIFIQIFLSPCNYSHFLSQMPEKGTGFLDFTSGLLLLCLLKPLWINGFWEDNNRPGKKMKYKVKYWKYCIGKSREFFFLWYARYTKTTLKCSKISVSTEATDTSCNEGNSCQIPGKTSPVRAVKSCSKGTERLVNPCLWRGQTPDWARSEQPGLSWPCRGRWGVLDCLTSSGLSQPKWFHSFAPVGNWNWPVESLFQISRPPLDKLRDMDSLWDNFVLVWELWSL